MGVATRKEELVVMGWLLPVGREVVGLRLNTLFGQPPRMLTRPQCNFGPLPSRFHFICRKGFQRVLRLPSIDTMSLFITTGDRMNLDLVVTCDAGPSWQVPVTGVVVTWFPHPYRESGGSGLAHMSCAREDQDVRY